MSPIETLESRQMLSATPTPAPGSSRPVTPPIPVFSQIWEINGTEGNDVIRLQRDPGIVLPGTNGKTFGGGLMTLTINDGKPITRDQSTVASIRILAKGGNDTVIVDATVMHKTTIKGGAGNDLLQGGSGDDTIYGGEGLATGITEFGIDTITGGAGDDSLHASALVRNAVFGEDGGDAIFGSAGPDTLGGGAGNDTIHGYGDDDGMTGGAGDDTLTGDAGRDTLDGQDGADWLHGGADNDILYGGAGNDALFGEAGNDKLYGQNGDDWLEDGDGNDTVDGGELDDVLIAGMGSDVMKGGTGNDSVLYRARSADLALSLDGVMNDGAAGEGDNLATDLEIVWGGTGNDVIVGGAADNKLYGEAGNDVIHGGAGNDQLFGWLGNDVLYGDNGNDKLYGEQANDRLYGGRGDDESYGQHGDDIIVSIGGGANDKNFGGEGYDSFWADFELTNINEIPKDISPAENGGKTVHLVQAFANFASKELDGQDLFDPLLTGFVATYSAQNAFSNVPLFAAGGPNPDDVDQNAIGDCYFMAGLSSVARAAANRIGQSVVDLGDGTYAVRFFNDDGNARYFRVDGQLAVKNGQPFFAGLGRGGSKASLWVPILEKAFACFRGGMTWQGIVGGDGDEAFLALGMATDSDDVIFTSKSTYMARMAAYLQSGGSVTACTDPAILGSKLTPSHCYSVVSVDLAAQTIRVRNPWAHDDAAFMQGANDGYMTIGVDQFDDDVWSINYAI